MLESVPARGSYDRFVMKDRSRSLVLIGLRGSGKSTIGAMIAERDGLEFADLDTEVLRLLGCPDVRAAWERVGEAAFREGEARALAEQLSLPARVLALGGGTPTAPGAAEMLVTARDRGSVVIVYLRATAEVLRSRLSSQTGGLHNRPSLTGKQALDEIDEVLTRRDGLYQRVATRVLDASGAASEVAGSLDGWREWAGPL